MKRGIGMGPVDPKSYKNLYDLVVKTASCLGKEYSIKAVVVRIYPFRTFGIYPLLQQCLKDTTQGLELQGKITRSP